jgi:hypothetical protein
MSVCLMILHLYLENLSSNGTASQSSTSLLVRRPTDAELAITGGPTHEFYRRLCATTNASLTQSIAWWMLTFPVDTVYTCITTVKFITGTLVSLFLFF